MTQETCKDCGAPMVAMNLNGDVMCKRLYTVAYMRWFNHDDGPVSHETLTEYERKIPLP